MSAPPPPPPPPPPPSLLPSKTGPRNALGSSTPKDHDRGKLLGEIQMGIRLKKTVTNDRSAPAVSGKTSGSSENGGISKAPVGGVGGLFANGIPKKPSDNKRNQVPAFKGAKACPPALPSSSPVLNERKLPHSESFNQKYPVRAPKPMENPAVTRQPTTTSVAERTEQFSLKSRPLLAPPIPPSNKVKPVLSRNSPTLVKKQSPDQFKTLRPSRSSDEMPVLKRCGSSDDVRNTPSPPGRRGSPAVSTPPPPLPASSHSRIAKPAGPPPPPPIGKPIRTLAPLADNVTSIPLADDDSPPPPPPPRVASCGLAAVSLAENMFERFSFVPIAHLPPPGPFLGFEKVYDHHGRRN